MQNPQQLFRAYPYQAGRDFKALREKRTRFIEALRREGKEAGLIK